MKIVEINGLYDIDKIPFRFPFKVWQYIKFKSNVIAKLDWKEIETLRPDLDERRCIWCFNFDGSVKWMIEPPYRVDKEGTKHLMDDAYLEMAFRNNILKVYTSWGSSYDLDIETGKISNWKHSK